MKMRWFARGEGRKGPLALMPQRPAKLCRGALCALPVLALLAASPNAIAQRAAGAPGPVPQDRVSWNQLVVAQVDPAALRETVARLVEFGTRHTASDTASAVRGIGAARRWVAQEFAQIAGRCGSCLTLVTPHEAVTGPRLPVATDVVDVVAIQQGSEEPGRVVLITAHLDSRVSDVMDNVHDAPGADDDASGVAAVLECARVLSQYHLAGTIVYGVLSGEEQGLYGGRILAEYAKSRGWRVIADLNNDIIGNTDGGDGVHDNTVVRVFSEGTRATETAQEAARRRYNGGEVDSPARNLSRYLTRLAQENLVNFRVEQVYRTDRYGRGGDQVEFLEHGFPAVRLTEGHENYTRQHQDLRMESGVRYGDTIDGVDFSYLAQVTRLNALALANMARAPAPPANVSIAGAVSPDTTIRWSAVTGAAAYRIYWRSTTAAQWQFHRDVLAADQGEVTLRNVPIDDWFFGVAAVNLEGFESPIVFPGAAGAFPP